MNAQITIFDILDRPKKKPVTRYLLGQRIIQVSGRQEWALKELIKHENGCTPIDNPAPRWSSYIHKLRQKGVEIESIDEKHGGQFSGYHSRYKLKSTVKELTEC